MAEKQSRPSTASRVVHQCWLGTRVVRKSLVASNVVDTMVEIGRLSVRSAYGLVVGRGLDVAIGESIFQKAEIWRTNAKQHFVNLSVGRDE